VALRAVAGAIAPAAGSIFLSVGTSMLVFPFFTYVHSTGLMGDRLPQVSCSSAPGIGLEFMLRRRLLYAAHSLPQPPYSCHALLPAPTCRDC
jgi:hypothetical protein